MNHESTRRQFLATAAATSAVAWTSGNRMAFAAQDDRFQGLPIGIQSYSLRKFNAEQAIRHIEGLGLQNVEFYGQHMPIDSTDEQIEQMLDRLSRSSISISAHGVNGFGSDHAANRRIFEFAKKAGIRNITANPQPESFYSLDRLVDEYNIRICIHNHGPGALYDTLKDVADALKGRHRLIGACVDTGHTLRSNEDPVRWIHELGARVFALHLKDVQEKQDKTHDVVLGTAHLDLVGVFKALRDVSFPTDGSLSLEYESSPDNPIDDIKQCLSAAGKAIAEAKG